MRQLCVLCHKTHNHELWKYAEYETTEGKRYGWFCGKWYIPSSSPEFVPQRVKDDRNTYAKSLLQPFRGGVASQEYIDTYGTGRFSPDDVKKAKNVWEKDVLPLNWKKSK